MSKNDSRRNRLKNDSQPNRSARNGGISKVYYIVIGVLFVVLLGLLIFIFSRRSDDITSPVESETAQIEEAKKPEVSVNNDSKTDETTEEKEVVKEPNTENESDNTETEESEESEQVDELSEGESLIVSQDAPHDPEHSIDFNKNSKDRVAIKSEIIKATGLDSNLIEWWIGNNGPGRVKATVSDSSQNEYYDVYLQYGEGTWHVTSYQRVSGNE